MSDFTIFKKQFQKHFQEMTKNVQTIFMVNLNKDELWEPYLNSFPAGTNEIHKTNREYDCNCCRHFIRNYGGLVVIQDNKMISVWDIPELSDTFKPVCKTLSDIIHSKNITDVFISTTKELGRDKTCSLVDNKIFSYEHFYLDLPTRFIYSGSKTKDSIKGQYRDAKNVFHRSMEELSLESGEIVLDLIEQGSLYRGAEFRNNIQEFIKFKKEYAQLKDNEKDIWLWEKSINNFIAKIRNTSIGTLLIDLSENMEVDDAVKKFEQVMAPTNYKRPKAIVTKSMIESAEKKIIELGYENSLACRHASIEDITVNNVLFVNRDARKKMNASVFDEMKEDIPVQTKDFSKVESVTIDEFIQNILPTASNIEIMMENKHHVNMFSLLTPIDKNAPSILKWNNNFRWSYVGNVADSISANVQKAGGNIHGFFRFSIQWNDIEYNPNDFDAHIIEPDRYEIYYLNRPYISPSGGKLDVDIISPNRGKTAVENIVYANKQKMKNGIYHLFVQNFAHRGGTSGFAAEIECNGQIYQFEYRMDIKARDKITVAKIKYQDGVFTILESLDSTVKTVGYHGIKTNQFSRVSAIMYSPNYWDGQEGIGNKHYFFILENCKIEDTPRGFYNEFLKNELMEHKRVFEVLGSKIKIEDSDKQLSGLGFSSTQKNDIIVRVTSKIKRVIKIIF